MKNLTKVILLTTTVAMAASCSTKAENPQKPNVIFILADDLGYGDIGCCGGEKIETPNIDRMARMGMLFTQNYAGNTVSAPSRCALMTGQHSGHSKIRGNKELKGEGQEGMDAETITVAELLKTQDYVTGAFGKWGLGAPGGESDPNHQGFDEFYGYNCQRQAHRYYPEHLWHNQTKVMLEGNEGFKKTTTFAPNLIQAKALEFIEANKDNPFFAYVAIVQPHAELLAEDDEHFAKYDGKFEEKPFVAKSSAAEYGSPNFDPIKYCSQPKTRATFAAMVSQVDEYVGEILDKVEELGIAENTLVIFSSDNGPHLEGGADPEFFNSNGPFSGHKRSLTEGGIRLPMIASWSGTIAPGTQSDHITAFWDLMPTLAELSGAQVPEETDGISYLPTLLNCGEQQKHEYLYWENMGRAAIRLGDWKVIKKWGKDGKKDVIRLYNLTEDIAEQNNIADQNPEIIARAEEIFASAHIYNPLFPLTPEEKQRVK